MAFLSKHQLKASYPDQFRFLSIDAIPQNTTHCIGEDSAAADPSHTVTPFERESILDIINLTEPLENGCSESVDISPVTKPRADSRGSFGVMGRLMFCILGIESSPHSEEPRGTGILSNLSCFTAIFTGNTTPCLGMHSARPRVKGSRANRERL